jgi:hypothetical protein
MYLQLSTTTNFVYILSIFLYVDNYILAKRLFSVFETEFEPRSWRGVLDTTLCDKVFQWLATGRWFSHGTPVSSTNKTDHHNITENCLKVVLNTINQTIPLCTLGNWPTQGSRSREKNCLTLTAVLQVVHLTSCNKLKIYR